jgi:hypothetical protein
MVALVRHVLALSNTAPRAAGCDMTGSRSARRRATRRLLSTTLIPCLAALGATAVGCGRSQSWGPSVPIGQTVSATVDDVWMGDVDGGMSLGPDPTFASNGIYGVGTATFTIEVGSIRCDSSDCQVALRVRNEEAVPAQYSCEQMLATDNTGQVHGSLAAGLGNTVSGCDATTMHLPHVWEEVPVTLFHVDGKTLTSLDMPGADMVTLPPGVR